MSGIMKDSGIIWIGEIPKHWNVDLLSRLFKEHKRKNINLIETNLLSLSYGKIIRKDINTNEGLLPQSFEGYNILSNGDIVFRLTDLQNDKRSLRTGLVREDGIITSAYVTIRKREPLNSSYFHYLFHSYDLCKVFYGLGDGVRQGMNFEDLKKILIIVPTLKEQQAIVDFLDNKCIEIDALIALQEKIIDELKFYKQAVITEAVTKGLNPNAPMKDSGIEWIGEIPEHWDVDKCVRIFNIIGSGTTPKLNQDGDFEGLINWIQSGDINGGTLTECKYQITEEIVKQSSALKIYNAPFIIIAMYGASVGNISLSQIDGCVNQACCVLSETNMILKYSFYSMRSAKNYLVQKAIGGGQPNINQEVICSLWLPYPHIDEQQQIADYLDQKCAEIDELTNIKQQKIDELKEYKKSMIYEYVTGKKQVNI